MGILRFIGIPEWREEKLDDQIMDAGMELYERGIQRPSARQIEDVLTQKGVDVKLRQTENPREDTIIVQRRGKK